MVRLLCLKWRTCIWEGRLGVCQVLGPMRVVGIGSHPPPRPPSRIRVVEDSGIPLDHEAKITPVSV